MADPKCALKESLEANARKAVAYEKGLETTLPDLEARKDALQGLELASLNLTRCLRLRPSRSSFQQTTASKAREWAATSIRFSSGRDSLDPLTPRSTYSAATSQPRRAAHSRSSASCISGF
jgi:hypothetical protein